MSINSSRVQRRVLAKQNAKLPKALTEIPEDQWKPAYSRSKGRPPIRVLRSRDFLMAVYQDGESTRLSINRSTLDPKTGRWLEGISWDELQRLKSEAGYGGRFAVEIYPEDQHVVDVANMRHLWILPERLSFAWTARNR